MGKAALDGLSYLCYLPYRDRFGQFVIEAEEREVRSLDRTGSMKERRGHAFGEISMRATP